MGRNSHERPRGRLLERREVLVLLGTSAGAAVMAASAPAALARAAGAGRAFAAAMVPEASAGTVPACVVHPEQIEGPYFVDERLHRSDIRSDPSDGSVSEGALLAFTIVVSSVDGASCVPLEGALLDVWHCDAAGRYSDVQDPSADTRGRKFLRGYQVTDTAGAVTFVTIYPGWYVGRAVHVHVKVRTDPDSTAGFEFTSQLYFDDAVTDAVYAGAPYATRGERTVRNAGDFIFQAGGDQLVLDVVSDGAGGYATTFHLGVEIPNLPARLGALESALPDPGTAAGPRGRRVARRLRGRFARLSRILARAATSAPAKQAKRHVRARETLQALLLASHRAEDRGTLGVPLAPIEAAVAGLLALVP